MANVTVFNMEGIEVGTMELNDAVFGVEVNEHLLHLAVVAQLANGESYEEEVDNQMDTKTLQTIAAATDAKFYHAASKAELQTIYSEIDTLEKTKLKVMNYDKRYEAFQPFAWAALLCFLLELLLKFTILRRLP